MAQELTSQIDFYRDYLQSTGWRLFSAADDALMQTEIFRSVWQVAIACFYREKA